MSPLIEEPRPVVWPEPREVEMTRSTIAESLQALSHAALAMGMAKDPKCVDRWAAEMIRIRLALGVSIERLYARIENLEERRS